MMKDENQAIKYPEYRALSPQEKLKIIYETTQSEENRGPNPQGNHQFNNEHFIEFKVIQDGEEIQLFTARYKTKAENLKGVVFLFHGLNSHSGRAAHIGWFLAEKGYDTVAFDHRGFGRSEGRRAFLSNLEDHLKDTR